MCAQKKIEFKIKIKKRAKWSLIKQNFFFCAFIAGIKINEIIYQMKENRGFLKMHFQI